MSHLSDSRHNFRLLFRKHSLRYRLFNGLFNGLFYVLFVVGPIISQTIQASDLIISSDNLSKNHLRAANLANPQPGLEEKFKTWSTKFTSRLTERQNPENSKLIILAREYAEPSDHQVRYYLGVTMSLPSSKSVNSQLIYHHMMLQSSGILIEDLNKALPILKMFSSGLQISFDLSNPLDSFSEAPKPELHYKLALNSNGGKSELIPIVTYPQIQVQKSVETKTSSLMPTWRFKGELKPTFASGPGLNINLYEATGFYQIEKGIVGRKNFVQKFSLPIPDSRITTTFQGKKPEITENNPVKISDDYAAKFQYYHQSHSLNLIFNKTFGLSKTELTIRTKSKSLGLYSAIISFSSQI